MKLTDYLSATAFAARYGVSKRYVLDEITRGNLKAHRIGSRYLLAVAENRAWIDNPKRGSRSKSPQKLGD